MVDLDKKANSVKWRYVYQFTWLVGVIALVIYTYYSWPRHYNSAHPDEYYVQFFIYGIYYLGMAGARWRYYQYETVRMYLITLGASIFICVMTLNELGLLSLAFLSGCVWAYGISSAIVIFAQRKQG